MRSALAAVALSLIASSSLAQIGGGYDLRRHTIAGGGAVFDSGGSLRLDAVLGQPAAGRLSAGPFVVNGGFLNGISLATTPTATVTGTRPSTPITPVPDSPTATATVMPTAPEATPTLGGTAIATTTTPTAAISPSPLTTPTATITETAPATSSPTATSSACAGDCDGSGTVTVDELIQGINIALGAISVEACALFDTDGNGGVTVDEVIAAVNRALTGCESGDG